MTTPDDILADLTPGELAELQAAIGPAPPRKLSQGEQVVTTWATLERLGFTRRIRKRREGRERIGRLAKADYRNIRSADGNV